jgi:membrane protein YdbS with pleckstrin-like domain
LVKDSSEKVIKPPVKPFTSGTIFKPAKPFMYKLMLKTTIVFLIYYASVILCFLFVAAMNALDPAGATAAQTINDYFVQVNLWTLISDLVWFVPTLILIPRYYKSIEYSVKAESGDTMPEIYSKRGILTVTRRHVPFRTITNISSQAGPFDRLFKIGSVKIETAGYSGAQKGPEENLNGIVFYEEVRDFILRELRKFREPYVTGTEVVYPTEEPVPRGEGLDDEILITLREIRDILKAKE